MNLRESLVLLIVGAIGPSVVADMTETVRKRSLCTTYYSAYSKNCTNEFDSGISKCGEAADEQRRKLEEKFRKNSEKLIRRAGKSCQTFTLCDSNADHISNGYSCLSQQCSDSATSMKRMSYEANLYQINYNLGKQASEKKLNSCTNTTAEQLNVNMNAGLDALQTCFWTGTWKVAPALAEPVTVHVSSENS